MAGRLFTEVRDKQGLAYSTGGAYPSREGPGVLFTQLGTAPTNQARAEAAMLGEIERIRREPVSPGEAGRAKAISREVRRWTGAPTRACPGTTASSSGSVSARIRRALRARGGGGDRG